MIPPHNSFERSVEVIYSTDRMTYCQSFPPLIDSQCRVLILGSMPGVASLHAQQYYAYPQNAFWRILFALWNLPVAEAYEMRKMHLLMHHVALWDAAYTCERDGSLDAHIRNVQPNHFDWLYEEYPFLRAVLFNGQAAQKIYSRYVDVQIGPKIRRVLPSTSPARTLSFAGKMEKWQCVRQMVEE